MKWTNISPLTAQPPIYVCKSKLVVTRYPVLQDIHTRPRQLKLPFPELNGSINYSQIRIPRHLVVVLPWNCLPGELDLCGQAGNLVAVFGIDIS